MTAQLFNVGAADRPDVLEAEVELRRCSWMATLRETACTPRANDSPRWRATRVSPAVVCGSPDDALPELERDATLRRLLDESPQVRAARADVARAQAATAARAAPPFPISFCALAASITGRSVR